MTSKTKPAGNAAVHTIHDDTLIIPATRGFIIATSANVTVRMAEGQQTVLLPNLAAGVIHALSVDQIHTTGTGSIGSVTVVW